MPDALVVPDWNNLRKLMGIECPDKPEEEFGVTPRSTSSFEASQWTADRRRGYEQVKKFIVLPRPFTVAADEPPSA